VESIRRAARSPFAIAIAGSALVVAAVLVPAIAGPPLIRLLTEVIILALFATAYNLVLGYGGVISFGHAAFFGLGAYTLAIFVVRLSLPLWAGFATAPLVAAVVGALFGILATRAAHLFVGLLTLAFAQMIWALFYKVRYTGGVDGIWSVPIGEVFYSPTNFYYFSAGIAAVCFVFLYLVTKSPFGLVLLCTRENRMRAEFIGVNLRRYVVGAFAISAFFSSIAGALYCMLNRGAYPELLHWLTAGNAVVMILLGGMSVFGGPILGTAVLVIMGDFVLKKTMYFQLVTGIIVILIVLLFPGGIAGYGAKLLAMQKTTKDV
jgi:branched-chain amino acid transport system permease protein